MKHMFRLPSPAMAVSVTALVVALGGTSYAAVSLQANSVGTKQLKNGSVTSSKIANNAVTGAKVKNGSLTTADLAKSSRSAWALVGSAGTVIAQSGGISVSNPFVGGYYVSFPSSRLDHGLSVTPQWSNTEDTVSTVICANPPQGAICDAPFFAHSNVVYVEVQHLSVRADGSFYITSTP